MLFFWARRLFSTSIRFFGSFNQEIRGASYGLEVDLKALEFADILWNSLGF